MKKKRSLQPRSTCTTAVTRRTFIKSVGAAGAASLLAKTPIALATEPTHYYFDSVLGCDSNDGLSSSAPLRGLAPGCTIAAKVSGTPGHVVVNIKRGSIYASRAQWGTPGPGPHISSKAGLVIQAYGDEEAAAPLFDCLDTIRADSEDPRAGNSTGGWTRLGESNVWRLPLPLTFNSNPLETGKVQRLWVGDNRTEYEDLPIRIIIDDLPSITSGGITTYNLPSEAQIIDKLTGATDEVLGGDQWDTFWYSGPSVEYPDSIHLYMYSGTVGENPVQHNEVIHLFIEEYARYGLRLTNCTDFVVSDIEIWGGSLHWIYIEGGSGTMNRVRCRYGNISGSSGINLIGRSIAPGDEFTFNDLNLSNDLIDSRTFNDGGSIDASGRRGTNDLFHISGEIKKVSIYGGEMHDACHAAISCPHVLKNNGFQLYIGGTRFFQHNVRYGRALNINGQLDCFDQVTIEDIEVTGQPTPSQISGENIILRDSIFRDGREPVGNAKGKYSGLLRNKTGTGSQLWICNLAYTSGGLDDSDITDNVWISRCTFADSYDAPIGYYNYSGDSTYSRRITNDVNWSHCIFLNRKFICNLKNKLIDSNRNPITGGLTSVKAIRMYLSDCESYGYSTVTCCNATTNAPVTSTLPTTSPATGWTDMLYLTNHEFLTALP